MPRHNPRRQKHQRPQRHSPRGAAPAPDLAWPPKKNSPTSCKSVERRAFKRSVYHVRDEEAALDIVQDSMMKLAEHYGDKPADELPMLFQRILSNCTLDWFRRQKTRRALFSNLSDFESLDDDGDFDLLETLPAPDRHPRNRERRGHHPARPDLPRDRRRDRGAARRVNARPF